MDVRLKHPGTYIISGSSGTGKTQWTKKFMENWSQVVNTQFPDRIVWFYSEYQPAYSELSTLFPQIEFIQGIPENVCEMFNERTTNLCIIDDLLQECSGNKNVANLFTKTSHHRNLSVLFITQNLFFQGKESRTISLNTNYITIFSNPRDKTQILNLSKQMYPGRSKFMREATRVCKLPAVPSGAVLTEASLHSDDRMYSVFWNANHTVCYDAIIFC